MVGLLCCDGCQIPSIVIESSMRACLLACLHPDGLCRSGLQFLTSVSAAGVADRG